MCWEICVEMNLSSFLLTGGEWNERHIVLLSSVSKEAGFLPSCEETPLQLSSQESFFRVSFVMPRHPGDSADIDRSVSLPSPPLHACRMVWHLSAARSAAAGAPPPSMGSLLRSQGSAGAAGCWHTSGLDAKLIDTTRNFGDDARRKNRRPVR